MTGNDGGTDRKIYPQLEQSCDPANYLDIEIDASSLQRPIRENIQLQKTVEELRKSLSEACKLIEVKQEDFKSLQRKCMKLEQFRKYKEHEFRRWEENRKCYKKVLKEEQELFRVVERLKTEARQVGKDVSRKDDEVGKLKQVLDKLRKRENQNQFPIILKTNESTVETEGDGNENKAGILIFPEEIWEKIFGNLSNPENIWNCSNTCHRFYMILRQWRTTWLFENAFPKLFKYLPKHKILECRLVSKGWNRVVDNFLEDHPSVRPHNEYDHDAQILPFVNPLKEKQLNMVNYFEFNGKDLKSETQRWPPIRTTNRNPFIGRAVTLNIWMNLNNTDDDFVSDNLWKKIYTFLATSGKYIWYLTINTSNGNRDLDDRDKEKMFRFLTVDLSLLTPNLRRLRMQPGFCEDFSNTNGHLQLRNLPCFSKLETIEADHSNVKDDHPIFVLLKRHQTQLRALHLKVKTWRVLCQLGLFWPNLTELQLDQLVLKEDFLSLMDAKLPKLKKLVVRLCGNHGGTFDLFLEVINKLCANSPLTTLRLYEGVGSSTFRGLRSDLCMPAMLTTLEVEHCGEYSFYTFLLRFPLLENLHIFWRKTPAHLWYSWESRGEIELLPESEYYRSEWREDRLPFEEEGYNLEGAEELEVDLSKYICQGKVYQSNVWGLLPRLKVFTFQWDVYTRAGYEQFAAGGKEN